MTKPVQPTYNEVFTKHNDLAIRLMRSEAALLQVREMLEAKAKEWEQTGADFDQQQHHEISQTFGLAQKMCAAELISLAATLGNQGE